MFTQARLAGGVDVTNCNGIKHAPFRLVVAEGLRAFSVSRLDQLVRISFLYS